MRSWPPSFWQLRTRLHTGTSGSRWSSIVLRSAKLPKPFCSRSVFPLLSAAAVVAPAEADKRVVDLTDKCALAVRYIASRWHVHYRDFSAASKAPTEESWRSQVMSRADSMSSYHSWSNIGGFFLNLQNPKIYAAGLLPESVGSVVQKLRYQAALLNLDNWRKGKQHGYINTQLPLPSSLVRNLGTKRVQNLGLEFPNTSDADVHVPLQSLTVRVLRTRSAADVRDYPDRKWHGGKKPVGHYVEIDLETCRPFTATVPTLHMLRLTDLIIMSGERRTNHAPYAFLKLHWEGTPIEAKAIETYRSASGQWQEQVSASSAPASRRIPHKASNERRQQRADNCRLMSTILELGCAPRVVRSALHLLQHHIGRDPDASRSSESKHALRTSSTELTPRHEAAPPQGALGSSSSSSFAAPGSASSTSHKKRQLNPVQESGSRHKRERPEDAEDSKMSDVGEETVPARTVSVPPCVEHVAAILTQDEVSKSNLEQSTPPAHLDKVVLVALLAQLLTNTCRLIGVNNDRLLETASRQILSRYNNRRRHQAQLDPEVGEWSPIHGEALCARGTPADPDTPCSLASIGIQTGTRWIEVYSPWSVHKRKQLQAEFAWQVGGPPDLARFGSSDKGIKTFKTDCDFRGACFWRTGHREAATLDRVHERQRRALQSAHALRPSLELANQMHACHLRCKRRISKLHKTDVRMMKGLFSTYILPSLGRMIHAKTKKKLPQAVRRMGKLLCHGRHEAQTARGPSGPTLQRQRAFQVLDKSEAYSTQTCRCGRRIEGIGGASVICCPWCKYRFLRDVESSRKIGLRHLIPLRLPRPQLARYTCTP